MQVTRGNRIAAIDIARGVALVAMTIYHFTWDLEFFHFLAPGTTFETPWRLFARAIATSFLLLVGVSLVLAHGEGIRWRSFAIRFAMVAGAAALISLVTWFAVPGGFIFFGILHAIAMFSLLALAFLRFPWWLNVLLAVAVLLLAEPLRSGWLASPALWWLGLAPTNPISNDYVPLFPWFAATLTGVALGQLARSRGWFEALAGRASDGVADRTLGFLGRHSLVYYLLHQPVMMGALWLFVQVAGPADRTVEFVTGCAKTCVQTSDPLFCEGFCNCTADGLKQKELFAPFFAGQIDLTSNADARAVIAQCSAR